VRTGCPVNRTRCFGPGYRGQTLAGRDLGSVHGTDNSPEEFAPRTRAAYPIEKNRSNRSGARYGTLARTVAREIRDEDEHRPHFDESLGQPATSR
jgi:hypothetical protein